MWLVIVVDYDALNSDHRDSVYGFGEHFYFAVEETLSNNVEDEGQIE